MIFYSSFALGGREDLEPVMVSPSQAVELVKTSSVTLSVENTDSKRGNVREIKSELEKAELAAKIRDGQLNNQSIVVADEAGKAFIVEVREDAATDDDSAEQEEAHQAEQDRKSFESGNELLLNSGGNSIESLSSVGGAGTIHRTGNTSQLEDGESALESLSPLKLANDKLRENVNSYSHLNTQLNELPKFLARGSLVNLARQSIEFQSGQLSIFDNQFVKENRENVSADYTLSYFANLLKKDLNDDSSDSKLKDLSKLAKDEFFQGNAANFFGKESLDKFNLAILGANLLKASGATQGDLIGINKSLNGALDNLISALGLELNENNGVGTGVSVASSDDWIEVAKYLSSDRVLSELSSKNEVNKVKFAYMELERIVEMLRLYKSGDLINLISVPLKFKSDKTMNSAMEEIMASMRIVMEYADKNQSEEEDFVQFKHEIKSTYKLLLTQVKEPFLFLASFEKFFKSSNHTNQWYELDENSFIVARRSVAMLALVVQISPLEDIKGVQTDLTKLILNSFRYIEMRNQKAVEKELAVKKEDEIRIETKKKYKRARVDEEDFIEE